jgi:hypothetical protein
MFKNYLKIAYRNILKHKVDSAINLVGLCVAFTAALLIFLSVFFEFSYDNFHKNKNDIYHIYTKMYNTTGAEVSTAIPVPMTTTLKNNYPEVLYAARYLNKSGHVRYNDKQLNRDLRLTDPDFLKMFSFPLIKGDAATALNDLNNIVLSEKATEAIFGAEDGIGKTIELKSGEDWKPFIVSAIISNLPDNSSIQYDMLARCASTPPMVQSWLKKEMNLSLNKELVMLILHFLMYLLYLQLKEIQNQHSMNPIQLLLQNQLPTNILDQQILLEKQLKPMKISALYIKLLLL